MSKNTLRGTLAAGLLLCAMLPAHAIPLTWTLSGVTFADGTTASGSFVFDAATRRGSAFSVSTMAGALSAFTFEDATSGFYVGTGAGPNNFSLFHDTGRRLFNFSLLDPLTDAGGTRVINVASSYECLNCAPYRRVVAGTLTTLADTGVPEPGSAALVLSALGMLGLTQWRRKRAVARARAATSR